MSTSNDTRRGKNQLTVNYSNESLPAHKDFPKTLACVERSKQAKEGHMHKRPAPFRCSLPRLGEHRLVNSSLKCLLLPTAAASLCSPSLSLTRHLQGFCALLQSCANLSCRLPTNEPQSTVALSRTTTVSNK